MTKQKMIQVTDRQYTGFLLGFSLGKIDLYTKKNNVDFVKLTTVSDVKKYAYRLYRKSVIE